MFGQVYVTGGHDGGPPSFTLTALTIIANQVLGSLIMALIRLWRKGHCAQARGNDLDLPRSKKCDILGYFRLIPERLPAKQVLDKPKKCCKGSAPRL